jgi:hypothetical protein
MPVRRWPLAPLLALVAWSTVHADTDTDAATVEALDRRMAIAADYLHRSIDASGRFVYKRGRDGAPLGSGYNLLRHAGSVWAMAEYYGAMPQPEPRVDALQRAARYLADCCLAPPAEAHGALALWSRPQVVGKPQSDLQAKLGGAGLALASFVALESLRPGTDAEHRLLRLARFLRWMQRADGSFYSKLIPAEGGRSNRWVSLYYPGEAALGLVLLYEHDGNREWLEGSLDALRYLARDREGPGPVPADHWALIATARVFRQDADALSAALPEVLPWDQSRAQTAGEASEPGASVRQQLSSHAERIVDRILAEQLAPPEPSCLNGAFDPDGRTTPAATRLEGLIAALEFLPSGGRRARTELAVARGMDFLSAAQITAGPNRGGFPRVSPVCGSADRRANEVRIDYVQHALSAMLGYRRYLEIRGATSAADASGSDR